MPVIPVLIVVWVGIALDAISTYAIHIADTKARLVELNTFVKPEDTVVFWGANLGLLALMTCVAASYWLDSRAVTSYLAENGFLAYVRDTFRTDFRSGPHSLKIVAIVSAMVFAGAVGGVKALAFVNNVGEYFLGSGFVRVIANALHIQSHYAMMTVVATSNLIINIPIVYWILRLAARTN